MERYQWAWVVGLGLAAIFASSSGWTRDPLFASRLVALALRTLRVHAIVTVLVTRVEAMSQAAGVRACCVYGNRQDREDVVVE